MQKQVNENLIGENLMQIVKTQWGIWLVFIGGCATGGFLSAPEPVGGEPWEVPPEAYPTQRLYRIKYQGPEGKASFKLALYLESAESYRMQASDALGRNLE